MLKKVFLFGLLILAVRISAQNEQVKDSVIPLEEVLLTATRLKDNAPFAHTNVSHKELETINLAQDLPILIAQMPSVVTTSDAGAGVGYTGIRVRGSDATRVNVTLNGIPYNDAESQGTYWVDLPDFTSSVEDIQLQRGVGTSTNGSGAFGASLSLKTLEASEKSYARTTQSFGSFNTRKHNISIGSGMHKGFYAEGRMSKIYSDGYIDRAFSDLFSFFTETGFKNKKTHIKAIVFGGKENTYQSWYGTPEAVVRGDSLGIEAFIARNYPSEAEAENLRTAGRTYNHYMYDNQVDNYHQNHYQLHFSHTFSGEITANISFNYTKGKGYYEQYKDGEKLGDYFPESADAGAEGDVIRRKWLDNDFYAVVYSLNYNKDKLHASLGGGYNIYKGGHFGRIIWDSFPVTLPIRKEYYNNTGDKTGATLYAKASYKFTDNLSFYSDAQIRNITYKASGLSADLYAIHVAEDYTFFNPKMGLNYRIDNGNSAYLSFAVANREPNRDDLVKNPATPKPERLFDWETGYRYKDTGLYALANLYFMNYKDQLILTGALDDVGDPVRQNVADSYRAGVEIQAGYTFSNVLKLDANASLSRNKIKSYDHIVYDTQYDPDTWETVSYEPVITTYQNTDISFSPNLIAAATISYSPQEDISLRLISKYVGKQYLDNTSDDAKVIAAYGITNFNASYTLKPKWINAIAFNLLVNNIFDKKYVSNGYTYSYYYRPAGSDDKPISEVFYYPQAGTNFLLGIHLSF